MRKHLLEIAVVTALLSAMFALMLTPIREESATNDEPAFLAAGYTYLTGHSYRFDPGQPPLAKKFSALPLLFMDVKISTNARPFLDSRESFASARTWRGEQKPVEEVFPRGPNSWYFLPFQEGYAFGNVFLFDGVNDGEILLWAGRLMQVLLSLATGVVIFLWTRKLAGRTAGFMAAALWAFNPVALAYGHLVITDIAATLTFLLAMWAWLEFLERPRLFSVVLTGLAVGAALLSKHTAILLTPMFLVSGIVWWLKQPKRPAVCGRPLTWLLLVPVVAWVVLMLGYAPDWAPAPAISAEQATRCGVPEWFQNFRAFLLPRAFFKGLACQMAHSTAGHEGFLLDEWRTTGWWYYYPVALALKTPVSLLVLMLTGLALTVTQFRRTELVTLAIWTAALVYLGFAMSSAINIGVRHLLPMIALITVATAVQLSRQGLIFRGFAWALTGWLVIVAAWAHPNFISYQNELAGNEPRLLDSNFDWGQDAKRLAAFLQKRNIRGVYQDYFGSNWVLNYYGIQHKRVFGDDARQLDRGLLAISTTRLMRPEWQWLRDSRQPLARVTDTIFLYDLRHDTRTNH